MIEKHVETIEDVERLLEWMQAPDNRKPDMPADMAKYLRRLQLADMWLRAHANRQKVWRMLHTHFKALGEPYSEMTARRDVDDAMRVFQTLDSHQHKYWTSLMLDMIGDSIMSAKAAHKYAECARLYKVYLEYLLVAERIGHKDPKDLTKPVTRLFLQSPGEAGVDRDPNILEKANRLIEQLHRAEGRPDIPLATVINDPDSPDQRD